MRNIASLLKNCEDYSKLGDIEVALYIPFPEEEGFVSYESADLSWRGDIEAMRAQAPPTLHLKGPLVKLIGHKVTGFYFEQKRGKKSKNKTGKIGQPATSSKPGAPKRLVRPPVRACRAAGKGAGDRPALRFPAFPPMPVLRILWLLEWASEESGPEAEGSFRGHLPEARQVREAA